MGLLVCYVVKLKYYHIAWNLVCLFVMYEWIYMYVLGLMHYMWYNKVFILYVLFVYDICILNIVILQYYNYEYDLSKKL